MPECEAERRIMQTLYQIELMWGSGETSLGKLKQTLLGGRDAEHCGGHAGTGGTISA